MIRFQPMTEKEFQNFRNRSLKEYIENLSQNYNLSIEAATESATNQFDELLKNGLQTKNSYIYQVVDTQSNENVGVIWYVYKLEDRQVFIYEIWMDPSMRGKGYGRRTMKEVHNRAKDLGADKVGLHVFGKNTGAIALYKQLGYEENSIVMTKKL